MTTTTVRGGEEWIVYQRFAEDGFTLRLVRPDGTGDHELVGPALSPTHPDWSPDGRRVVFTANGTELWTVRVDGSRLRRLPVSCDPDCYLLDGAAWSPDGRTIAYSHITLADDVPTSAIETLDLRSSAVSTMYVSPDPLTLMLEGRWSPTSRAFVVDLFRYDSADSSVPNGTAIGIIDRAAGALRILVDWGRFATYPDWSPVGDTIVFSTFDLGDRDSGNASNPYAASDLYTIRADGSRLRQLTHNATGPVLLRNDTASGPLSAQPRWTPDGTSITFVQVDGSVWPGWTLAAIPRRGGAIGPATSNGFLPGTHPQLRPTR